MAKQKTTNKPKGKTMTKVKVVAKPRKSLDSAGLAYAALLADPCNAPLVHPTYSGTEGGYLVRADTFITIGIAAAATSGYLQWTPGYLSDTNSGLIYADGPNAAAGQLSVAPADISLPGLTFLKSNADAARCVAACMKVSFPGTEASRSGRVHYGQTTSSLMALGGTYAPDAVAQALPFFERTPADIIELIWKPNDADQLFMKPGISSVNDSAKNNKCASLCVAFAGLPATVGLTFHFTAVYEWQPGYSVNLANPNLSKSPSNNSLDEVVNYLIGRGFGFVKSYAMSMGRSGLEAALGQVYGIMGANPSRRSRQALLGA